jgi:hypothetical protein
MNGASYRLPCAAVLAAVAAAVCLGVAAGADAAPTAVPSGTWVGWAGGPIAAGLPRERLAQYRITVGPQAVNVVASGPTGASHDSPSARATCTSRFRFEKEQAGWRHYVQTSGTIKGEGGLETAPCSTRPETLVRLRPAGAKLKVEFGTRFRARDAFGDYLVYATRA